MLPFYLPLGCFNTDKKLVIESFIQVTLLKFLCRKDLINVWSGFLNFYNVVYNFLFVYCYWVIQIAVIQEVIISSPIVAELHILFFYFKHKTSRGEWHLRWNSYKCKDIIMKLL